jgi:hypothetical protein
VTPRRSVQNYKGRTDPIVKSVVDRFHEVIMRGFWIRSCGDWENFYVILLRVTSWEIFQISRTRSFWSSDQVRSGQCEVVWERLIRALTLADTWCVRLSNSSTKRCGRLCARADTWCVLLSNSSSKCSGRLCARTVTWLDHWRTRPGD